MRYGWPLLISVVLLAVGCGAPAGPRRSSLSDDDIAAYGARPSGAPVEPPPESAGRGGAIELADGERLEELQALIRFDPGGGAAPTCALYTLRAGGPALQEGRATVACDPRPTYPRPDGDVALAPVEEARGPQLVAALAGAVLEPHDGHAAPPSPRSVHLWLTTDRRRVEGPAAPLRWPTPGATEPESPVGHRPANLSEVWEAVMYPERYR